MLNFQMSLSPYKLPSFLWIMFAQEHGLPEKPQTEETELLVGKIRLIPISQQGHWGDVFLGFSLGCCGDR